MKQKISKYFIKKTSMPDFIERLNKLLAELEGKKVLLYGAGIALEELIKHYPIMDLNIVTIADMKFENETTFCGKKAIHPLEIPNQNYDIILITNEQPYSIKKYLTEMLEIDEKNIATVFEMISTEEHKFISYLEKNNFQNHLNRLSKKLKNKSIVIYGAGLFFQILNKFYNLSSLNIIGISDRRFVEHQENEEYLGYKVYAPLEIQKLNPDYVLVSTLYFINIMEDLYYNTLKPSKIKIKPLVKKPLFDLLKEIWNS